MDAKPTSRHRHAHHHTGGTDSSTKRRSRALSSPPLPPYSIGSPNGSILSLTGSTLIDNVQSSSANRTVSSNSASVSRATSLHRKVPSRKNQESVIVPSRFSLKTDGAHEHHLRVMKRQEKLGQVLKDLLGGKKLRNQAVSAVPNLLSSTNLEELDREAQEKEDASANHGRSKPPTLLASLFDQVQNGEVTAYTHRGESLEQPKNTVSVNRGASASLKSISFFDRYGTCQEVIGRGSFGVVRVAHKKVSENGNFVEKLFAVKEFKKRTGESEEKYSKRLTNEFCISSSLKHSGLIDAFDLLRDAKGDYCEVMEYCSGGDLYSLIISAGRLEPAEADCFFKQLIRAVHYMHEIGVAHRDLKPENLLLTADGTVKITDFGNAECFRMAWEDDIQLSRGVCGSSPYIAPEEYVEDEFDPRPLDVWACGVIYMAMRTGRQMWKAARVEDEFYSVYLAKRKDAKGYEPIEALKRVRCRNVVYSILDPIPERRITTLQILNSEWMRQIVCCKRPKLSEAKGKPCGDKS
ncbi:DEKNAAC101014 [Brettanomyces naardenensis]|uniref:non-specific serine/threonine protein kinase n=1 Tax=Brettanomyces naardenensis TaxID=13370 RepID=A0A448YGL4_BRENA|nr:DEKNAAC101014 [Brettanomyces naardenensis]